MIIVSVTFGLVLLLGLMAVGAWLLSTLMRGTTIRLWLCVQLLGFSILVAAVFSGAFLYHNVSQSMAATARAEAAATAVAAEAAATAEPAATATAEAAATPIPISFATLARKAASGTTCPEYCGKMVRVRAFMRDERYESGEVYLDFAPTATYRDPSVMECDLSDSELAPGMPDYPEKGQWVQVTGRISDATHPGPVIPMTLCILGQPH